MIQIFETNRIIYQPENDFIYNRFDEVYSDHNTCITAVAAAVSYHVPVHTEGKIAFLGLWCYELPGEVLEQIIRFIFHQHRLIRKISIQNSPTPMSKMITEKSDLLIRNHWKIELPERAEELEDRLSAKKRYNIRREKRIIEEKIGPYVIEEYTDKSVPEEIVKTYFQFKRVTYGIEYHMLPMEYLNRFHVTNIYVLRFSNYVGSIIFSCEQGEHVYLENLTYNPDYQKYSMGSVLYDEYLKILCLKRKTSLYLGWGKQLYKSMYGAVEQQVFTGTIYRNRVLFLKSVVINRFWQKCKHKLRRMVDFRREV